MGYVSFRACWSCLRLLEKNPAAVRQVLENLDRTRVNLEDSHVEPFI